MYYIQYYLSYIKQQLDLAPSAARGPFRGVYDVNGDNVVDRNDYPCRE